MLNKIGARRGTRISQTEGITTLTYYPCNDDELLVVAPAVFRLGNNPSETEFDMSYALSKLLRTFETSHPLHQRESE